MTLANEILIDRLGTVFEEMIAELRRLNARLQELSEQRQAGEGMSSLAVEDMAKGPPKITSKTYDAPLSRDEIDAVLDAHAYAHRRAEQMAIDGWRQTLDVLNGGTAG